MDSIMTLYTTTGGRISRRQWWLGVLGLVAATIVLLIIVSILGMGSVTVVAWLGVLVNLALIYPYYCLSVKRRHDRDNDGKDVLILMAGSVVINLLVASGIGATMTDLGGGVMMPVPPMWLNVIQLIFGIFGIYMLVQLGFLKGTAGPNSYGADPLELA